MKKFANVRKIVKGAATLLAAAGFGLTVTGSAAAQDVVQDVVQADDRNVIAIDRDITELRPHLVPRPDVDIFDTALVFNNPGAGRTLVVCAAFDANGNGLGRAKTVIPGNGVRFLLASDVSNGADFVGSVVCKSRAAVVPSGFLLGAALTNLKSRVERNWNSSVIRFSIVVSY